MAQKRLYSRCSVPECTSTYYKGRYCPKHRSRMQRTGTVRRRETQVEWLERQVAIATPGTCIIWPFSLRGEGYGAIEFEGEQTNAHRVALRLFTGRNPRHLNALHGPCHKPACVNPHHLSWGTQSQNMLDKRRDGTVHGGNKRNSIQKEITINVSSNC
jgi:hypothetical protein